MTIFILNEHSLIFLQITLQEIVFVPVTLLALSSNLVGMDCADSFACLIYLMIISIHQDVSINVINKIILEDVPDQWTQRGTSRTATNNTFPTTSYRRSQPDSIAFRLPFKLTPLPLPSPSIKKYNYLVQCTTACEIVNSFSFLTPEVHAQHKLSFPVSCF